MLENIGVSKSLSNPDDAADSAGKQQQSDEAAPVKPQITVRQAQRIHAPARNMIISMAVMIAILIPILWLAPQLTNTKNYYEPRVDLPAIAVQASQAAGYPVAAPELEGWTYNFARWNSNQPDGVDFWNTGMLTAQQQYIELIQAKDANPTWVAQKTQNAPVSETRHIAGLDWEVRVFTDQKDASTKTYYIGKLSSSTLILAGQADPEVFEQLAQAVLTYNKNPTYTPAPSQSGTSGIL